MGDKIGGFRIEEKSLGHLPLKVGDILWCGAQPPDSTIESKILTIVLMEIICRNKNINN